MAELEKQFTTLYLGYSPNLSPVTMKQRCLGSLFVGTALLKDYKWIINSTSYASIIPSVGDVVYGSLYFLSGADEKALDTSEGVPWLYEKQYLHVHRVVGGKLSRRLRSPWRMLMCKDSRRASLSPTASFG
jgi:gamma-glutamylcyclotransferase